MRFRSHHILLAALLAVVVSSPLQAGKPELIPIRTAVEAREYDRALSLLQPLLSAGENSGEALYLLGAAQAGKTNWADAETALTQAMDKRYQEPEVKVALARVLIGRGRPQEVAPLVEKAMAKEKDPKKSAAFKHVLGLAELAQGNYSKAQECLLGARVDDEDNLEYREALGDAYSKGQVYPLAAPEYEAVLNADSSRLDIMFKLAEILYLQRRLNEARPILEKLLKQDPSYSPAYFKLANIYMIAAQSRPAGDSVGQQLYKAALSQYRKVREVDPKADPVLVAKNIATVYYLLNAHDSAIVELQNAIQTGASDPELQFYLGRSNMLLGNHQQAIDGFAAYRKAREAANPPQPWTAADAEFFWRTAMVMEALKDSTLLPQIAENYRKAMELDPNDERAIGGLALALHKLNRYAEAAVEFEKLVQRHPNDSRTLFNASLPYLQSDNNEKAVEYLLRAADNDSSTEATYRIRAGKLAGPRLIKMQRFADAQRAYKWLIEREGDVCENRQWYGYTFFAQKNYQASVEHLRRAYKCNESQGGNACRYKELTWWLAYALYETGEKKESYAFCKKVIECDPKHKDAQDLMNRIDEEIIEPK